MVKKMIKRALISVSSKDGIVDFAKQLIECGIEIISTGGTKRVLEQEGIPVTQISAITNFPEILDGRVKTLHPVVYGGILAIRDKKEHMAELEKHNISPIDMVVVNLYPFCQTIKKDGVKIEEAIENIDIGGPSMIRAAAKNFRDVTVVVNPNRYDEVLAEIKKGGNTSLKLRASLAHEAFKHTSEYDKAIAKYFEEEIINKELL